MAEPQIMSVRGTSSAMSRVTSEKVLPSQLGAQKVALILIECDDQRSFRNPQNFPLVMMPSLMALVFDGNPYWVLKSCISEFLAYRRQLLNSPTYAVRSAVPLEIFLRFVHFIKTRETPAITAENAASLSLLAEEFHLSELASECLLFSGLGQLEQLVEDQKREFESIQLEVEKMKASLRESEPRRPPPFAAQFETPPPIVPQLYTYEDEYPWDGDKWRNGIIHAYGSRWPVSTAKSVCNLGEEYAPQNVANFHRSEDDHYFSSKNAPGQWICWDFEHRPVCPTHYTIRAVFLQSWVLDGSLDGETWTEMHAQRDCLAFRQVSDASFRISRPVRCRFIRLLQTGLNCVGRDDLWMYRVQFFGTVLRSTRIEEPDRTPCNWS
jgi:hypothetical protein